MKTNFYTYAGVVQALEGVSFDMLEGETLGLVGETGCGKSVTATSILRLIPQPPGRIEEGEILFDLPPATVAEIERLEASIAGLLPRIFGDVPEAHPEDLSIRRLRDLWDAARERSGILASDLEALRVSATALIQVKERHDLLAKSDAEMRAIRGNQIAMIFQDPMQSLNPVFPIGDQIAENILLHQKAAVISSLVQKMELEAERDDLAGQLSRADPAGRAAPGRLPPLRPVPRGTVFVAFLWMALSAVAGVGYGLAALAGGSAGSGALSALGLACVLAAGALLDLRAFARPLALALAVPDALLRIVLILLTLPLLAQLSFGVLTVSGGVLASIAAGFLFHVVLLAADALVLRHVTAQGAISEFTGRRSGWAAALFAAEGEPGELGEVRDLVRESDLPDREALVERLDTLIERAKAVLLPEEPISGHFRMILPRGVQLTVYRSARDHGTMGVWDRLPIVGRMIKKPLNEEGVRWGVNMLRRVRIPDPERIARQYPYELSGGMQQRALIAIALSCNPRLLIADEPTTALDVTIQAQILELIREMKQAFGSSVLIITHDLGIIAEMCNRVCVMYAGHIVEDAAVRSVFKAPLHPYTQGLMKAIPSHTVKADTLAIIRGSVPNLIYPPPGCRFHPRCPAVMPTCGWSPAEVADHLRAVLRTLAAEAPMAFDVDAIRFDADGATAIRVAFPEGTLPDAAVDAIRRAVEVGRARPAVGAVTGVEVATDKAAGESHQVVVRILEPRKPPSFYPEPNHAVACLLYEEGIAPLPGGPRVAG